MTPTVLHLLVTDDWGGTEVQVAELVARSRAGGASCDHVVAFLAPQGAIGTRLLQDGHEVHLLGGRGGAAGALARFVRLLRARKPDVLEAYGFRAAMTARAALALGGRGPRLLVGVRGLHITQADDPDRLLTRAVLRVELALSGRTTGYDANSRGARDFLVSRGFPAEKFTVIANGVEPIRSREPTAAERPAAERRLALLCVARFAPVKRHDVLLHALALLTDVDLRCRLVGDGPTRGAMETLARRLSLNGAVEFCGRLERGDVVKMLLEADVFVLCSRSEGLPGSVLEAMTAGAAVVGTDVNGIRELLDDGRTGLLVPTGDHVALAGALRRLATDRELRASLALAGWREASAEYSYDKLVSAKNEYFAAVAQRPR